jgi:hypothetical protein
MTKEEKILVAKTKLEVYKEVEAKVEEMLEGSSDILFDYENELFLKIQGLEDEIDDLENFEEVEELSEGMKKFIMSLESWERLTDSEAAIIRSIVEVEKIEPISTGNSLHIYEERYMVDGELFRFTSAISDHSGNYDVEKLKK